MSEKNFKVLKNLKYMALLSTAAIAVTPASSVFAAEDKSINYENASFAVEEEKFLLDDIEISKEDEAFIDKVVSISEFYTVEPKSNELTVSLSKNELINTYGFTEEQYDRLQNVVLNHSVGSSDDDLETPVITPYLHVSNGALYISNTDLNTGAFAAVGAAATVSPAALQAALIAVSSVVGGPVGTVLSTVMTVISGPSLIELAGRTVSAIATGRGIYIKPVFDYPPLDIGYWG